MLLLRPLIIVLKVLGVLLGLILIYFIVTGVQVWLTARHYDPTDAQAIVVMGAAQYNGTPSPDLQARLNEALTLYHQGYSSLIVLTGSKEPGDRYTEAEAGDAYLTGDHVPTSSLVEVGGDDTWQSLSKAAAVLKARGDTTVLIVTDGFHEDRSMAVASDLGLNPYPTPTQDSPIKGWGSVPYYMKEAVGVGLGRVIGFQNLHALG
jgi:uncharacterized SAM-binding protein YcdF (DUF218 family)